MAGEWFGAEFEVSEDNTARIAGAIEEAIQEALRDVGEKAVEYAQDKVPVRTGALKESIGFKVDDNSVSVGTGMDYGPYVELGTYKMKARPFLRPAMTEHASEYRTMIEQALRNS